MRQYSLSSKATVAMTNTSSACRRHEGRSSTRGRSRKHRHHPLWVVVAAPLVLLLLASGCNLQGGTMIIDTSFLNDMLGWDISACGSGFNTCIELVADNQSQFLGGSTVNDTVSSTVTGLLDLDFD